MSCLILLNCGCGKTGPLSKKITGTWEGKLDVAKILSYELSREMGIDNFFDPDPIYSDISISFNKDLTGEFIIDKDDLMEAMSEAIEPVVSAVIGFDTSDLVDSLFKAASEEMEFDDTGRVPFEYEVDDEEGQVLIRFENDTEDVLVLNEDGNLESGDIMGTKLEFKKGKKKRNNLVFRR